MAIIKIDESYSAEDVTYFRVTYKPSADAKYYNTNLVKASSAEEASAKLKELKPEAELIGASPCFNGSELDSYIERGMPILDEAYIVKPEVDLFDDEENQKSYDYGSSDASDDWCECNDCGWFGESDELINGEICPDCGCADIIREPMNESIREDNLNSDTKRRLIDKARGICSFMTGDYWFETTKDNKILLNARVANDGNDYSNIEQNASELLSEPISNIRWDDYVLVIDVTDWFIDGNNPMNESKKAVKESTKAGGRFTINFGHWVQAKSFPTQIDLLKFLRSHVISSSSIITLAKNVTDDYMKSTWYDTAENIQKFNLTSEQRHEIFEKGYTKINQNVSEQMQRNPEDDGWPGIVEDTTREFFNRAASINYEIVNCVRGSYAIKGDTIDDLIKSLRDLKNDLIDTIDQLQADARHINESFDTDYSDSEVYQASSIESLNNYAAGLGTACKDLKPGLGISVKGYYVERSDDGETYHVWNDLGESKIIKETHSAEAEDKFAFYFPNIGGPKILNKERAIKQLEFELDYFKNNSGSRIAGRGFGVCCFESVDSDTGTVWTGRYSSGDFLKSLNESKSIKEDLNDPDEVLTFKREIQSVDNLDDIELLIAGLSDGVAEVAAQEAFDANELKSLQEVKEAVISAIDLYLEDNEWLGESLKESTLSISDLKAFYNTSTSIDREKYPNFFVWYDDMVRSGRYKNEALIESDCKFEEDYWTVRASRWEFCPHCCNNSLVGAGDGRAVCDSCGEEYLITPAGKERIKISELTEAVNGKVQINKDQLKSRLEAAAKIFFDNKGYDNDFIKNYVHIEITDAENDCVKAEVRAEVEYETLSDLADVLNAIVVELDRYAYFDLETTGIINAYIRKDQTADIPNETAVNLWSERFNSAESKDEFIAIYKAFMEVRDNLNSGTVSAIYDVVDSKFETFEECLKEWSEYTSKHDIDIYDFFQRRYILGDYEPAKRICDMLAPLGDPKIEEFGKGCYAVTTGKYIIVPLREHDSKYNNSVALFDAETLLYVKDDNITFDRHKFF